MNKALFLAGALALAAVPALAQSGPDDRGAGPDRGRDQGSWRGPGGDRGWRDGSWRDDSWREGWGGGRTGGWRESMGDDYGMGGGRRRGARFMVRSGDAAVAVRCDPSESMRSCLDATLTLLDRARGASASAGGGATGSGTGSGSGSGQPRP